MPHFIVDEGLPKSLERALRAAVFEYSADRKEFLSRFEGQYDEEFSVTDLPQAPKQLWLRRKFRDDIVINLVKDNYFSLLGTIIHSIMEKYAPPGCIVEERQQTMLEIDGKRILIHGKPDIFDPAVGLLEDWKFTSPWSVIYDKPEYEFQLNVGRYLFQNRGFDVDRIRNVYLFRELNKIDMLRYEEYPKTNIQSKEFKPWPRSKTEEMIKVYVRKLMSDRDTPWKKLPDCTDDERWIRDSSFGVYKRKVGKKNEITDFSSKACGRFPTMQEAKVFAAELGEEFKIAKKSGEPKRCMDYCPVTQWCQQRQKELQSQQKDVLEV